MSIDDDPVTTLDDLKGRIDDLLSAGRIDLQRICGPDAAAKVEAIEAGS